MARFVRRPTVDTEYTFRRVDKTGKIIYDTYRFTGEVTPKGRFVFYEVRRQHFMDCTLNHFSYLMRKQFVRQKSAEGKISKRVTELLPIEKLLLAKGKTKQEVAQVKEVKDSKADEFCRRAIAEFSGYSAELKEEIKKNTGVNCDNMIKVFEACLKHGSKFRASTWNSLMNNYVRVASYQGVALKELMSSL